MLGHVNLYCFRNFTSTYHTGRETGGTASADHQVAAGKEDDPHVSIETNFALHLLLQAVILSSEKILILRTGLQCRDPLWPLSSFSLLSLAVFFLTSSLFLEMITLACLLS